MHTHAAVLRPLVRDNPGGLVPEETFIHPLTPETCVDLSQFLVGKA